MTCDSCRRPAERLATIGKGDASRHLCSSCVQAALLRRRPDDSDWKRAARRLEQHPDWQLPEERRL